MKTTMPIRFRVVALAVGLALLTRAPTPAEAQELEPRAYSNSPVGFNFLLAGYTYSLGGLSVDPSVPVQDAQIRIHSGVVAYARALDLGGKSGKVDVVLPFLGLSGTGTVAGQAAERKVTGFGDPRLRLSINLYGAPALSMKEFAHYQQDLVIGASLQVSLPLGQYDADKAINLGTNRWWVRADAGFSKALKNFTLDFTTSAALYSDNGRYFGSRTFEQSPIYAAQTNLSYEFGGGVWAALGTTYYRGGQTMVNGVANGGELGNSRAGGELVLPLSRHQSVKLGLSRGVYTRAGTAFSVYAIAWQYRWGAGY
jgi:outer membrane putative beta-barrel porin/alpha-amylase